MAPTANPRTDPPTDAAAADPPATAASVAAAEPSGWAKLVENPLQTFLAAAVVVLLAFGFTVTNDRITETNDRITETNDRTNDRITRLEARIDRLEEKMEARFAAQDEKIDEINLKLTALIAALGMTDQVDAAVTGAVKADST